MKLFSSVFILAAIVVLSACSKKDDATPASTNSFSATINGTTINFQYVDYKTQGTLVYITASDGVKGLNVSLPDTTGTIIFKKGQIRGALTYLTDNSSASKNYNTYVSSKTAGTLDVTKNDTSVIEGTITNAKLYNADGSDSYVSISTATFRAAKK